jgi:uncharacterized cupin superfamily protein
MPKPIVNMADVEFQPRVTPVTGAAVQRYEATFARIGALIGARQLGYNITAVPPGKRAYPFHSHRVNEEMFFVLAGTGEVRIGADRYPLRQGDFVACPMGGPEAAHQIINTGQDELRYLAVSTQRAPEICEYPDSGKFGVTSGFTAPGADPSSAFRFFGRTAGATDYWDGE